MKNAFHITLLSLLATPFFAQPVITSNDLLKVGDIVATQPCATTTFNPGSAGANQAWDFSQLTPEGPQDTTFYILPAGTPYAANYPSSNIVGRFGADGYGYYQVSGDKLFFWGQTDPSSALVLTNPATYFQSPATYGTFVLDTIAGSLSAGPLSGSVTGQVYFQGDGYGSLQTPGGQYSDVLRVKTVTVAVATVPFLGTITDSVYNYSWYKLGVKTPVLEMIDDTQWSGGAVVSQTRYVNYFLSITSGANEPAGLSEPPVQVFPNPAEDAVQFSGLDAPARVVIQNIAGQCVLDKTIAPQEQIGVESLRAGVYCCSVYPEGGKVQFLKLVVQR